MNLAEFLSSFFCGGLRVELDDCKRGQSVLADKVVSLQGDLEFSGSEIARLQSLCNEYLVRAELAEADTVRFYELLQQSIQIPVLPDLGSKVKVYPFNMTHDMWHGVRPEMISDNEYYAWDEATWLSILGVVQPVAKKAVGRARPELSDCDNYSLTMCDLLSLAFMRSGLDRQGAFMKLLSTPHSYCGFMMPDYTIRVYEPVSGTVVGWLGETGPGDYGGDTYRTQQAFFLS